jgi:hypothetical protein
MAQHVALRNDPVTSTPDAREPVPPALAVMIVHGTFPRGPWQQLRRSLRVLWTRMCSRRLDETTMWPTPALRSDRRWWFEFGSEFEVDLVRRTGLPPGSVIVDRFLWSGRNTFTDRAEAARSLRTALRNKAREHPGVAQVVLAHSHGGNVAVKALDTRDELCSGGGIPKVRALLTLGTPFVRLVSRSGPLTKVGQLTQFVDERLPVLLLLLSVVMALYLGVRSHSVEETILASVLVIAALVALLRMSPSAATTIIVITLGIGDAKLREDLIGLTSLLAFVVFSFGKFVLPSWFRGLFELGKSQVEDEPLYLRCPLLALRAPRDEASLVIGLGQVLQGLAYAAAWIVGLAARPLERPLERLFAGPGLGPFPIVLIAAMCSMVLIAGWFHWTSLVPEGASATAQLMTGIRWAVVVGLGALLAWALPTMAVSLVAGREAFMLPAGTIVEAEPLPNARAPDGVRRVEFNLEILYEARLTGLKHSLHDSPEVRERIGIWLREQAGTPNAALAVDQGSVR